MCKWHGNSVWGQMLGVRQEDAHGGGFKGPFDSACSFNFKFLIGNELLMYLNVSQWAVPFDIINNNQVSIHTLISTAVACFLLVLCWVKIHPCLKTTWIRFYTIHTTLDSHRKQFLCPSLNYIFNFLGTAQCCTLWCNKMQSTHTDYFASLQAVPPCLHVFWWWH